MARFPPVPRSGRDAARLAAAFALALAAAGCGRPALYGDATVQALRREGAYLTGEVTALRRDAVLDEGGLATGIGASRRGEVVAFTSLQGDEAVLTAVDRSGSPRRLWTQRLNAGRREVEAVDVSPDGAMIATAGRDGFLRTFHTRKGFAGAALSLRQPLVSLAIRADGAQLVVGTAQGRVMVVKFPELEVLASAELHGGQEVRGVAYRPDGAIVSGGWDRSVVISRQDGGDLVLEKRRQLEQYVNDVQVGGGAVAVALSAAPAERTPEVVEQEQVAALPELSPANAAALLDAASLEEVFRPVHHRGVVSSAAVSPDGLALLSGGWDGQVLVTQRELPPDRPPVAERFNWLVRKVRLTRDARYALVAAWTSPAPPDRPQPPSVVVEELARRAPEVAR